MAPASYPHIAGLDAAYPAKQLRDFRGGKRRNAGGRLLGEQPAR
jgi:cytochrome c553